eukprot:scaffold2830_cov123-Isochrysis_galbana.AAC.10
MRRIPGKFCSCSVIRNGHCLGASIDGRGGSAARPVSKRRLVRTGAQDGVEGTRGEAIHELGIVATSCGGSGSCALPDSLLQCGHCPGVHRGGSQHMIAAHVLQCCGGEVAGAQRGVVGNTSDEPRFQLAASQRVPRRLGLRVDIVACKLAQDKQKPLNLVGISLCRLQLPHEGVADAAHTPGGPCRLTD